MRRTITKGTCSVLLCVTMLLSSFWGSFSSANATALYSSVFTDELTKYLTSLEAVSEEDYFDTDAYLKQIEEIAKQQSLEVSSGGSSSGETQEEQEVDYWLVEGKFSGITGKVESGFPYTDRMWLVDSKSLSVDLARMSVILACAAYDADNTWHLLDSMKFDVGEDYDPTLEIFNNYGKKLSINDNDHVAFTIAHKIVVDSETGEEYLVYCVPIRGTSKNAEWYSDFNLGTGAFHLGFSKAGNEVLGELGELVQNEVEKGVVRQDGQSFDSNHRIILFTGHSRGAAVSNYVSGLLTVASENQGSVEASIVNRYHLNSKFESNHIFAYTFACPSVTTNTIAETLENVYNFNNAGDCVTLLPLTGGDWGYLRYGKDIVLYDDEPYFDNFQRQFKREVGKDWKSLTDSYHYLGPLYSAFPTPNDFRKGTPQLVFTILAYALGGSNDTTLEELRDYILSDLEMAIAAGKVVYKVLYRVISTLCGHPFTLSDLVNVIVGYANSIYDEKRPAIIDELLVVTESLTSEEIILLKREREYEYKFALIESTINSEINSRDDLIEAKEVVSEWRVFGNDFYSLLYMVFEMYFKSSGETTFDLWYFLSNMKMTLYTPIEHGHAQETYVCWINSKFLGYKGWNGSSVGTLTIPNDIVYIPTNCFYNCRAEIITNHDVYFVGKKFSIIRNLSFSSVNDASYIIHSDMEIKFSMGMVSNGTKVVVDGSIVVQGNADQITPQLINYGNLHITGDYTSENWLTELHNNGDLTIEGNLACNIPKDNVVTLGKLFQEQEDAILTIGGNVSLGLGNGQVTITSGKVVLNGTKQQSILGLIAKDFEVINPEGIKYLSDTKLYGEYKLNNNPLENNGFRTLLYNGSTFADDSDYGELSVSGYYYLDSNVKGNFLITSGSRLIIAEGQDITIDGKVVNRGNSNSSYPPQLINNGKLHITGDYTSENWLTELHNNGDLTIEGNLACNIPKDNVVTLGKLFQEQEDAILTIGGNVSLGLGNGQVTITSGKVVLNGTKQQSILGLIAKDFEVINPEGIKYLSDTKLYGEYKLNNNPLENNGFRTLLYNGSTFADDSDYGELSVSGYYYLDSNVKGNFLITSGSRLIIAEGQDITIDGKVVNRGNSNSSYPPQLINNGKLHITGDYTSENWLTELHNNGELIIDGDLICSIPNDNVVRLGKLFQEQKGATLSVGGNVSLSAGSGYVTITNGKVILSGKQRQEILYLSRVPYLVLENQSPEGVVFKNAINVTTLFNHNQNAFTLYNNGSGSVFVDYDGDGLKDNVDPYPMVGNPCVILVQSIDPEQGTVSVERLETIGGTTHTVVATPTFKYNFLRWEDSTGKNVGTATELTFVARGDQTYTAHFVKRTQPISVSCENGTITAPAKATIESEVTVSVTENTGFILDESSLKCNGVPFTNFTFVMPDEPAVITAVCNRNTYYFNLLDKIGEARAIDFRDYSTESYSNLVNVIQTAGNSLYNHITKAESDAYIQSINEAIAALKARYVIDIDAIGKTEYFCGQSINPEDFTVLAIYDNGTVEERHDYTTNEIDFDNVGYQTLIITAAGISKEYQIGVYNRVVASSVSVGHDISADIYMQIGKNVLANETAFLKVGYPDHVEAIPISQVENVELDGKTYQMFSIHVAAKEMNEDIVFQLVWDEGRTFPDKVFRKSIRGYCEELLAGDYSDGSKEVAEAMLNYGAYAQRYFNYDVYNLANAGINSDIFSLGESLYRLGNVPMYTFDGDLPEGLAFLGVSLVLNDYINVKLYFEPLSEGDYSEYGLKRDATNNWLYWESEPLVISELKDMHTAQIGECTVNYVPLYYVQMALDTSTNSNMVYLAISLLTYYTAVNRYIHPDRYSVVFFDGDGNEWFRYDFIEYMMYVDMPPEPYREGYVFVGWDKEFNCVTEDLVINAIFEPIQSAAADGQ